MTLPSTTPVVKDDENPAERRRLVTLLSLGGTGVRNQERRTAEEIDQHIRWLRSEE